MYAMVGNLATAESTANELLRLVVVVVVLLLVVLLLLAVE
jgi:hypothetical protein